MGISTEKLLHSYQSFLKKEEQKLIKKPSQPVVKPLQKVKPKDDTNNIRNSTTSHSGDFGDVGSAGSDDFGDSFTNLLQIGEEINNHVESGSRPPDETLVDTLTMMKNMLAQAQTGKSPQAMAQQAALAKQKAVKNIQSTLTKKILSKLDDNQPMVEVANKLKVIKSFQPQIQDMERRMAILKQVEPILESAINLITKCIDMKGMMPAPKPAAPPAPAAEEEAPAPAAAPAAMDQTAMLQQLLAQQQAAAAPAPAAPAGLDESALAGAIPSDLLSSLSFAQISDKKNKGAIPSANGKDEDGFDEEVLILSDVEDGSSGIHGMKEALNYDPLSTSAEEMQMEQKKMQQAGQAEKIKQLKKHVTTLSQHQKLKKQNRKKR